MATYGRYAQMLEPKSFSHFKLEHVYGEGSVELKFAGVIEYSGRIFIQYYTNGGLCRSVWHFLDANGNLIAASYEDMIL